MKKLSYTQLVVIDIYRDKEREELIPYLKDVQEYIDNDNMQKEVRSLIRFLEKGSDADYRTWQKEASGMDDSVEEQEFDTFLDAWE